MQAETVKRTYNRKEIQASIDLPQKEDIDLTMGNPLIRPQGLENLAENLVSNSNPYAVPVPTDIPREKFNDPEFMAAFPAYMAQLAFNEEPITIIIEENSRPTDYPETHVPVAIDSRPAEILVNGKWAPMLWFPIGQQITTKRKYVEVLLRSRSDAVKTMHDDANVEKPRNTVRRTTTSNYPVTIIEDANPKGAQWASMIRRQH